MLPFQGPVNSRGAVMGDINGELVHEKEYDYINSKTCSPNMNKSKDI